MSCLEMAKEEGMEEGVTVGRMKEKQDVAKAMKLIGLDNETISKCTKLPVEEIEKI